MTYKFQMTSLCHANCNETSYSNNSYDIKKKVKIYTEFLVTNKKKTCCLKAKYDKYMLVMLIKNLYVYMAKLATISIQFLSNFQQKLTKQKKKNSHISINIL